MDSVSNVILIDVDRDLVSSYEEAVNLRYERSKYLANGCVGDFRSIVKFQSSNKYFHLRQIEVTSPVCPVPTPLYVYQSAPASPIRVPISPYIPYTCTNQPLHPLCTN